MGDVPKKFVRVEFGCYTDDDVRNLSVLEITNQRAFDLLSHATVGGLYDRRLGPYERSETCGTCGQNELKCPGHMGHIELPVPVYNPLWMRQLELLVRGSCFNCKKILEDSAVAQNMLCMVRLIDADMWDQLDGLQAIYCEIDSKSATEVASLMKEFVDSAIHAKYSASDYDDEPVKASRFINQARNDLINKYMSTVFASRKGHCNHCSVPIRKLRQEHHIRMFFDEGASRRGVAKAKQAFLSKKKEALKAKKKKEKMKSEDKDEGFEDELAVVDSNDMDVDDGIDESILDEKLEASQTRALLTAGILRQHMRQVWDNDSQVIKAVCGMLHVPLKDDDKCSGEERPTDVFFLSAIPVPPTRFRPVAMRNGVFFEHPINLAYTKILESADGIRENVKSLHSKSLDPEAIINDETARKQQAYDNLHRNLNALQQGVNNILDRDLSKIDNKTRPPGFRQIIEKKHGLFRKHMMGKRVDYAARSVISPDPFLAVDEVGIPEVFAKRLTFPEPVNVHNVARLRKAVINGPDIYPGATHVITTNGLLTRLSATNRDQREALASTLITVDSEQRFFEKPKTVFRHLKNGDMLLMNRQPTLHRPSIQAHKAHVLPGEKTIRLHYANCNAYNADFDGDEMNAHFPQSYVGQSEAREIVTTHNQYLVPKNGTPLAGLIQDHVIGGVTLCMRGRFFTRQEYQQLVFSGLVNQQTRVKLLPPTIMKPMALWTGKQVISTLLINLLPLVDGENHCINLIGKSKIPGKSWMNSEASTDPLPVLGEETVVIRQGHLLQGVLDKNHYGATRNGLVHCCYELYGGGVSAKLLTSLARLFTTFLKGRGFSLGVQDIMCKPMADKKRHKIMKEGTTQGSPAAALALGVKDAGDTDEIRQAYSTAHFDLDDMKMKELDLSMKTVSDQIQNDVTKVTMPNGLLKKFPENNLQLMVVAGAKGSSVNCMQISCLLGQIELEGRRPPLSLSGRSLPSFLPYDTSPRAGGFVDGRFLSGIRPQEYFFHCMAGREGLVDTAVKTSRSGYLQRCLIKHLEGIMVAYDSTVRDCDGSIVQFQYGEDSLSILKTNLLNPSEYPFLIQNHKSAISRKEVSRLREVLDLKKARRWDKQIKEYKRMWSEYTRADRKSAFLKFTQEQELSNKTATVPYPEKHFRTKEAKKLEKKYRKLPEEEREKYDVFSRQCPEPTISKYPPMRYLHSLPERLRDQLDEYKKNNPDGLLVKCDDNVPNGKISVEQFEELISLYMCRSQAEPGDSVGILAAQSIGEPSTQMTLNTFHFAGRGEMNVTLGIPRLREILMVASKKQKTPSMDIPFLQTKYAQKRAKNLQLKLNTVKVADVLEKVDVTSRLITTGASSDWGKMYKVLFQFLPPDQYIGKCLLTPKFILRYIERTFIKDLARAYLKAVRANSDLKLLDSMADDNVAAQADDDRNLDGDDEELAEEREDKSKKPAGGQGDDDDDELDEMVKEAGEDHDAVADKELSRYNEEHDYDGEEDELAELLGDERATSEPDDGESAASDADGDDSDSGDRYKMDKLDSLSSRKRLKLSRSNEKDMNPQRIANVLTVPGVHAYSYDVDNELWCEITFKFPLASSEIDFTPIIQSVANASLICDPEKLIKGVVKAILVQPKNGSDPIRLRTDGVNIQKMFQYTNILDLNNLYTNDIHAMAASYGIEAACRILIKEVRDVFAAYGITVNYRHLSLISDYMTFDGEYKAFNRTGLMSCASSLQKMTFEASTMYLKNTMLSGAADDIESPSARIVVGRPVKVGTGLLDCVTDSNKKFS